MYTSANGNKTFLNDKDVKKNRQTVYEHNKTNGKRGSENDWNKEDQGK